MTKSVWYQVSVGSNLTVVCCSGEGDDKVILVSGLSSCQQSVTCCAGEGDVKVILVSGFSCI